MNYEIDKQNYRILISGSTKEIKKCIISLDQIITKGNCLPQLEEDLKNLHKIYEPTQFNFNRIERIYYTKNSLLFVPNVSAKEFYFPILEKHFEQAKKYLTKQSSLDIFT
ncbi:hypothetical protein H8D83_01225 [Candidatus Woesearchaeota archaeon]|nr:hypothetical protein [Candidatus Woesearchaeota archaeon]MBL7050781.1 hypothetical protein [Candidatus Woesearchaeota archaeon]